jgi:hypothetical protein
MKGKTQADISAVAPKGAAGHHAIGKAVVVYGHVKAIAADGTERMLQPNSLIYADDRIITDSDGSISILLDGTPPTHLNLGRMMDIVMDEDVYGAVTPTTTADATAEAERIQQLLAQGEQPIQSESPAAGGEASAGGGHPIVNLALTGNIIDPESGAETRGIDYSTIDTLQGGVAPTVEEAVPIGASDNGAVDEDGLEMGIPDGPGDHPAEASSIAGDLGYDFGGDGPAAVNPFVWSIDGLAAMGIASHGHELLYEVLDGGLTINAYYTVGADGDAETVNVFTLKITDPATGAYSFTLHEPLDHPIPGTEDDIIYNFTYTLTDGNGSTAGGSLEMLVDDDTPVLKSDVSPVYAMVHEDGLAMADGDLSDGNSESVWVTMGDVNAVTYHDEGGHTPTDGLYMARLNSTGTGNQSSIESFLGLDPGDLTGIAASGSGYDNATNGSAMKATMTVSAGDVITFDWFMDADDYNPYNDFVFATINGQVFELSDISQVGSYNATSWATFTYTATSSGPIEIGFGAMNTGDSGMDTYLLVDNLRVNGVLVSSFEAGSLGVESDSDEASGLAGSLGSLIDFGADGPGSFALLVDTTGLPNLYSKGDMLTYAVTDSDSDGLLDTLTATAADRTVFTMQVNPDGSWHFDLNDQLDHVNDGNDANGVGDTETALYTGPESDPISTIDFSTLITATDFDGDPVPALNPNSFLIAIENDVPIRASDEGFVTIAASVQEDGMSFTTDDLSDGNKEPGDTNADDETSGVVYGSLASLVKVGADEEATFEILTTEDLEGKLPTLYSKGEELTYESDGHTLTAMAGDRLVFTLTVESDGDWTFDLNDQLDHVAGYGENYDLVTGEQTSVPYIDFAKILLITDADGDALDFGQYETSPFSIAVQDDIPIWASVEGEPVIIAASVEEDGMSFTTDDLSDGNKEPGDTNADDETSGVVYGSLTSLVKVGADEEATFAILTTQDLEGKLPTLYSQGEELSYTSDGHTLTAMAGDRLVFTLTVESDGDWTFDLNDQLDHVEGNGENYDLVTGEQTSVPCIDFAKILLITDADGDALDFGQYETSPFSVAVQDDIPVWAEIESEPVIIAASVQEDGMSFTTDDLSDGNKEPGDTNADDETSGVVYGSLASLVKVGADEEATFEILTTDDLEGKLPTLYSKGEELSYTSDGHTLTAMADDRLVFTLTVESDGDWTFDLNDQLDHVEGNGENYDLVTGEDTSVPYIDFAKILLITDADGDALDFGQYETSPFSVAVQDDIPVVPIETLPETWITLDESIGVDAADPNAASDDDVSGNPFDPTWGTPIGLLMDVQLLDLTGIAIGADENGGDTPHTCKLEIAGNEGLDSDLKTTDGDPILLYTESDGTITGRIDSATGTVIFAVSINNDGEVTIAQYDSLYHPDDTDPDDYVDLKDKLSAVVTVTDYDGDQVSDTKAIGDLIRFEDDGPYVDVTKGTEAGIELKTRDAYTDGVPTDQDVAVSTANFSGVFAIGTSDYGTDGPGTAPTLSYQLGLVPAEGTASGLFSHGAAIKLYIDGNTVTGSTAGTEGDINSGNKIFTIAVEDSSGVVTLTQFQQLDHGTPETAPAYDDDIRTLADNLVTLTASATITDNDDDSYTDSEMIDLGGNIKFADDGPYVNVTKSTEAEIELKTRDAYTDGVPTDQDTAVSTANFSGVFAIASSAYGADGPGTAPTLSYQLNLVPAEGTASGFFSHGAAIKLYINGNTVTGSTASNEVDINSGNTIFTIAVNGSSGVVTLTQFQQLDHGVPETAPAYDDDIRTLADNLVTLTASATITDYDNDSYTDSETIDLGGNIKFADDGPASLIATHTYLRDNLTDPNVTGYYSFVAGADGPKLLNAVEFDHALQGQNAYDANDKQLYYNNVELKLYFIGDDYTKLVASTAASAAQVTDANTGYWIDINNDGTYTVHANGIISNGTDTHATYGDLLNPGNMPFGVLTDLGTTTQDAIITGSDYINTSENYIGIGGGQNITAGDGIRIDLVNDAAFFDNGGGKSDDEYDYSTHNLTTRFSQDVAWLGNPDATASIILTAIVADDDPAGHLMSGNLYSDSSGGDTYINLSASNIVVYDGVNPTPLIQGVDYFVDDTAVNTVTISGIEQGWTFEIITDDTHQFNAVMIEGAPDTEAFKLGYFSYGTDFSGIPVDLNYEITGTDFDGDTTTGWLETTFTPNSATINGSGPYNGTAGDDYILGNSLDNTLNGYAGNDLLVGNAGTDSLYGGDGNDTLMGGAGNDTLDGGAGIDLIDFSDGLAGISFTLVQSGSSTAVNLSAAGLGTDSYSNMEGVIGTGGDDILTGSSGNDVIKGGAGDDIITGGAGSDIIYGGTGVDTIYAQDGVKDTIHYNDNDVIGSYDLGVDDLIKDDPAD